MILRGVSPVLAQFVVSISPHDFPYGYPSPDYLLEGVSVPSLFNDYMSDAVYGGDTKRVSQYALHLLYTNRADEVLEYVDEFLDRFPDYRDERSGLYGRWPRAILACSMKRPKA